MQSKKQEARVRLLRALLRVANLLGYRLEPKQAVEYELALLRECASEQRFNLLLATLDKIGADFPGPDERGFKFPLPAHILRRMTLASAEQAPYTDIVHGKFLEQDITKAIRNDITTEIQQKRQEQ